jgi:hypothetical protein
MSRPLLFLIALAAVVASAALQSSALTAQDETAAAKARAAASEKAKAQRDAAQKAAEAQREQAMDAQAQQMVQMSQPLMWRELEFIRQTCNLAPEQRPKIKEAAETSLKKAVRTVVMPQRGVRTRQGIRLDLAEALRETLTPEQFDRYSAEAAKREAALKQATLLSVVAQIDAALFLTDDQRETIKRELEANWQDDWEHWLQMSQHAGRYFPQVPDQHVAPHLNPEQKSVWQGLQKVSITFWGGQGERNPAEEEWWAGRDAPGSDKAGDQERNLPTQR